MMTEHNEKHYECESCDVIYDFDKFKTMHKKWTNKVNRRKDYPVKTNFKPRQFDDYDDGVLCDTASSYTFRFRVEDQEGFASVPYEVRGENRGR